MKQTHIQTLVSILLCVVLMAASALTFAGCDDATSSVPSADTTAETQVLGDGATVFYFHIVGTDGKTTRYEIRTDKTLVGDALEELGLISGDPGPYGLYVKTVGGITIDPDTDRSYWAFYDGDTYASSGVDTTTIRPGATYRFQVEKG